MIEFDHFYKYYQTNSGSSLADIPPEEPLYHYTDTHGLLGILEKNELWATHYKYLNDASEVMWGLDLFFARLQDRISSVEDASVHENIAKFEKYVRASTDITNIFVFCLSSDKNLLNQWRNYGGKDVSYSIALDVRKYLFGQSHKQTIYTYRMIYEYAEQIDICDKIINCLWKYVYENKDNLQDDHSVDEFIKMVSALLTPTLLRIKNSAFKAEQEWRMVIMEPHFTKIEDIRFRSGRFGIIPYFPISMADKANKLPISEIVVGPHTFSPLARSSLEMYLERTKRVGIAVSNSIIPIR